MFTGEKRRNLRGFFTAGKREEVLFPPREGGSKKRKRGKERLATPVRKGNDSPGGDSFL